MIDRSLNYGRLEIASFLEKSAPFDMVLDLGAGHGDDLEEARRYSRNAKLHAVEGYEPYARELEARRVQVDRLNIERDRLPFANASVDLIIANQILEHTKEIFWILHEVSRVLKVGGHFILGVPNLAALHNRFLLLMGRQPSPIKSNSAHVRGFTKNDILAFLESGFRGGYALEQFKGSNFYPFPPLLARPLAKTFPSMAWGIFLLLRKTCEYEGGFLSYPINAQLETNFYLGE